MPTPNALLAGVLSTAALLGSATVAHAAEPDLLARWALDAAGATTPNAVDSRLDGTSVAGTPVQGRFGSGLSLTRSPATQGFFAADAARLVEPKSVTVLTWVKRASAPENWAPIVAKSGVGRDDPGQGECELNAFALISGGEAGPNFAITTPDGSAGGLTLSMTDPIPAAQVWDDKWHAIAGIFDATNRTLSVALDGKVVSTTPADGTSIAYDSFAQRGLSVGRYPHASCDGDGVGFDGAVDEVRVYGRALGAAELAHLQNSAATTPPTLPIGGESPTPAGPPQPEAPSGPTTQQPAPAPPNPLIPTPAGSISLGTNAKPSTPKNPPAALKDALAKATKPLTDLLKTPGAPSKILKDSPKLKQKELSKLKPSASLDALLDQLVFGLPLSVKVPASARYAYVGAALTIRRKTPAGKIEIHTIALPPAVFAAKNGLAIGRVTIDRAAAKVLRKSGAVDAAVGIVSVLVGDLPNATPPQKGSIDDKLAKQLDATKQLDKDVAKLVQADKTADKFGSLADKAKGTSGEKKAAARAREADEAREKADEAATQTAEDLAKLQQQALEEMLRQVIEFLRQLKDVQLQTTEKLTRV